MREQHRVAIIGGGFSGVALAAQLLRRGQSGTAVTLIESSERLGRGVAYGTPSDRHLTNTRAAQMSVYCDEPDHFVRWSETRGEPIAPGAFVRRRLYGEYVEDALRAEAARCGDVRLEVRLQTSVRDVRPGPGEFSLALDDRRALSADSVVLATGHPPPADPLASLLPRRAQRYLRDPWAPSELDRIAPGSRVLLLGTGLTMVDVALELAGRDPGCEITAISRNGLLPREHAPATQLLPRELGERLFAGLAHNDLRAAIHVVRATAAAATARGFTWHAVIDALRPATPRLWAAMCAGDRRRFVKRVRAFWDVHRHRMAPTSAAAIAELRATGRLAVAAARVRGVEDVGDGLVARVHSSGDSESSVKRFDWIVNCTGPAFTPKSARELDRRLCERGLLLVDPLGIGFVTAPDGTAFGSHGPVPGLYVLGPACRARCWENTAVPEIRQQADNLADVLTASSVSVAEAR
jgi:uncharacterized NAD(P)/FAD-binding protein YdhS